MANHDTNLLSGRRDAGIGEVSLPNLVTLAGFGWSGSGAVVDFLKNVPEVAIFPKEIRLLKDIDGLINLRTQFEEDGYFLNTSIALERFRRFCAVLARENRYALGFGYDSLTNNTFSDAVKTFCDEVSGASYWSDAFVFHYGESDLEQIFWKILRKFGLKSSGATRSLPVPIDMFDKAASKLVQACFAMPGGSSCSTIVLDQALNPWGLDGAKMLLPNMKMIVVDRDPRDIFVDYQKSSDLFWPVDAFIESFAALRERAAAKVPCSKIMSIQFEKFVCEHDSQVALILEFLGISNFKLESSKFDPERSKKNIGIHKTYGDQSAIQKISECLSPYCNFIA